MFHAFRHDEALLRSEIDRAIFQIDQETAIDDIEEFIKVAVRMPMILAFDHTEPHNRFVHLTEGLVVPLMRAGIGQLLHIHNFERTMQHVQESLVRKILCRVFRFHG